MKKKKDRAKCLNHRHKYTHVIVFLPWTTTMYSAYTKVASKMIHIISYMQPSKSNPTLWANSRLFDYIHKLKIAICQCSNSISILVWNILYILVWRDAKINFSFCICWLNWQSRERNFERCQNWHDRFR